MGSGFSAPQGPNRQNQQALTSSLEETNMGQFGSALSRFQGQLSGQMEIGGAGLSSLQSAQQAKELAALRSRSNRQAGTMSAIGTGLSLLGGVFGGLQTPGAGGISKAGVSAIRKT